MADHKRKKKRGRSKLFKSCFRSFANDEGPFSHHNKLDDTNLKNRRRPPKPVSLAASDCNHEEKQDVDCGRRPSHRRGVSGLIKSVLFDAVMVKKIRSSSKSSITSDANESFQSLEKNVNECSMESTDVEDSSTSNLLSSSSRNTSSSYTSSSSSSTNSNSRWSSDLKSSSPVEQIDINRNRPISTILPSLPRPNLIKSTSLTDAIIPKPKRTNSTPQSSSYTNNLLSQAQPQPQPQPDDHLTNLISSNHDKIKSGCNNLNIRWCLFVLLSLVVLVMYGRIYSILCTSIWFYLVPCRQLKRVNSVSNATGSMDTESTEQYKKRVIMAGLLDRTRNPLR